MVALVIFGLICWWAIAQFTKSNRAKWERRFTQWPKTWEPILRYFAADARAVGMSVFGMLSPTIFRKTIRNARDELDDEWKKFNERRGP